MRIGANSCGQQFEICSGLNRKLRSHSSSFARAVSPRRDHDAYAGDFKDLMPILQLASRIAEVYGIRMREEWVAATVQQMNAQHPDASAWSEDRVMEFVFDCFLTCDLHVAGRRSLPNGVQVCQKRKGTLHVFQSVALVGLARLMSLPFQS